MIDVMGPEVRRACDVLAHYRRWGKALGEVEVCERVTESSDQKLGASLLHLARYAGDARLRQAIEHLSSHWRAGVRALAGRLAALHLHFSERMTSVERRWCVGILRKLIRDHDPAVSASLAVPAVQCLDRGVVSAIGRAMSDGRAVPRVGSGILVAPGPTVAACYEAAVRHLRTMLALDSVTGSAPSTTNVLSTAELRSWLESSSQHFPSPFATSRVDPLLDHVVLVPNSTSGGPTTDRFHIEAEGAPLPRAAGIFSHVVLREPIEYEINQVVGEASCAIWSGSAPGRLDQAGWAYWLCWAPAAQDRADKVVARVRVQLWLLH